MTTEAPKVGIISCSGEAVPEGTLARLATRRVLELLRPDSTVTLCLPLFLAGNENERNFARAHPTLTIDGCPQQCARWGTERHSGPVSGALVVSDLLGTATTGCHRSTRDLTPVDQEAVWTLAERLAAEVDRVRANAVSQGVEAAMDAGACTCSSPLPGGALVVQGEPVRLAGLPQILAQCAARGIPAEDGAALLDQVKIYHPVPSGSEGAYREALVLAYRAFRSEDGPTA